MLLRDRLLLFAAFVPAMAQAQGLDLMYHNTGLSIGDSRLVHGIRLNFRDDRMREVVGINATIWSPYSPARGVVKGLALGVPVTGARTIKGFGIGIFGAGAEEDFTGIGGGLIGVGAGGDLSGLFVGGIGAGAGGNITGITIGGIGAGAGGNMKGFTFGGIGAGAGGDMIGITIGGVGAGAGGNMRGITIAGIGAGAGGNMTGFSLGLVGAGAGGNMKGIAIAGIGAGAGGDMSGVTLSGVGVGAGGDVTGLLVSVIGAGAGGTLRGIAFGGVGVGAPRIRGIAAGLSAGGHDVRGGVFAPLYFKVVARHDRSDYRDRDDYGYVKGITVSSWNHIKGEQHGLSIGLLNTAWELHGWQFGLLNYAKNNPKGLRLLPILNHGW